MPPVTRSSDMLNILDGLFYLDDDVLELASKFYNELRCTIATFGEDVIVKLVPYISSLLSKLNELCKLKSDLQKKNTELHRDLTAVENKCDNLNTSVKEKCLESNEIEHLLEEEIVKLKRKINQLRDENVDLRGSLDRAVNVDVDRIIKESDEKIAVLNTERRCLLTSIEVMEAEMRCLKGEVASLEQRVREQPTPSVTDNPTPPDLQSELTAAATVVTTIPVQPPTTTLTPQHSNHSPLFKDVLLIGDSLLRFSSKDCSNKGAFVECIPGGKILDIKHRLSEYVGVNLRSIFIHVGTNNLSYGYRGGPGYNGGHGKKEVLHSMADLLFMAKTHFPNSKIFLNSILIRNDIGYKALNNFNNQLELMCWNFDVKFVDANCRVARNDLSRDGVHLNRRGVHRLSTLFVEVLSVAVRSDDGSELNPDTSLESTRECELTAEQPAWADAGSDHALLSEN